MTTLSSCPWLPFLLGLLFPLYPPYLDVDSSKRHDNVTSTSHVLQWEGWREWWQAICHLYRSIHLFLRRLLRRWPGLCSGRRAEAGRGGRHFWRRNCRLINEERVGGDKETFTCTSCRVSLVRWAWPQPQSLHQGWRRHREGGWVSIPTPTHTNSF